MLTCVYIDGLEAALRLRLQLQLQLQRDCQLSVQLVDKIVEIAAMYKSDIAIDNHNGNGAAFEDAFANIARYNNNLKQIRIHQSQYLRQNATICLNC